MPILAFEEDSQISKSVGWSLRVLVSRRWQLRLMAGGKPDASSDVASNGPFYVARSS